MRRLNFEEGNLFKYRFKRRPKKWTIPIIHELWIRAKIRSQKRQKDLTNFLNWIVVNIKPNDGRSWIIFYDDNKFYHLEKTNHLGVSYRIGYSGKDRESKINSIIVHSDTIELGKRIRQLERMTSHLDYRVKTHLDRLIYNKIPKNEYRWNDRNEFIRINDVFISVYYSNKRSEDSD